jgi:hypothetical protein
MEKDEESGLDNNCRGQGRTSQALKLSAYDVNTLLKLCPFPSSVGHLGQAFSS